MIALPEWSVSAVVGFAVSVIVAVVLTRPSDREALLETLSDTGTLLIAVSIGGGVAIPFAALG